MPATGPRIALVAQRTRASDYGSEGWGFESLRARKFLRGRSSYLPSFRSSLAASWSSPALLNSYRRSSMMRVSRSISASRSARASSKPAHCRHSAQPALHRFRSGTRYCSRIPSLLARTCAGWFRPPTGPSEVLQPRRRARPNPVSNGKWAVPRRSTNAGRDFDNSNSCSGRDSVSPIRRSREGPHVFDPCLLARRIENQLNGFGNRVIVTGPGAIAHVAEPRPARFLSKEVSMLAPRHNELD